MRGFTLSGFTMRVSLVAALLAATAALAALPASSSSDKARLQRATLDASKNKSVQSRNASSPLSYRSPGARHKFVVPSDAAHIEEAILSTEGQKRVKRYGSYTLVEADGEALARLDAGALERVELRDDMNLILLKRGQIDTTAGLPAVTGDLALDEGSSSSLHMVQLFGPPTNTAMRALKSTGAKIVSYIPNNAYLIWATGAELDRVRALTASRTFVQWDGPFHPAYKLDRNFKLDSVEQVRVSIELLDTAEAARTVERIKSLARRVLMREFEAAGTIHLKALIESFRLPEIARIPDVLNIEPWAEMKPADERGSQIVAGVLSEETVNSVKVSRPTRPGYMAFLNSVGFNSNFDFAVDITDTGFDVGSEDFRFIHPDFLDAAGRSRIAYMHDFSDDFLYHPDNPSISRNHDTFGHGTLIASIIGGFNTTTGSAFTDALGFQYGMGVAPFARIGITKLFDDQGRFTADLDFTYIRAAYRAGARISNNSWGQCDALLGFCNLYNEDSRIFDSLVRDADPQEAGSQPISLVFAAGNSGNDLPASIAIPATAKNVITVGASEGFRPADANGQPLTDGCGASATFADNALDGVGFSGRGPVQDGRAKPDLIAPGTHIVGAAPQDQFYASKSVDDILTCDRYFPAGQSLYTWGTGTSFSAPFVSGGAALAFQWLRTNFGADPSPALVKALILNSTTYVTGNHGRENLPGAKQGWGLLNLSRMFETTDRIILDESPARTFTESGGSPFEMTGVISDTSKEFRVMLVWTEPPGSSTTNAPYINQLNLEVVIGGVTYNANRFAGEYSTAGGQKDILNNVQGVRLPAGTVGPFVIRVRPTIIAGAAIPGHPSSLNQDFALVVTNGREKAVPVLTLNAADEITQGVAVTHANGATDAALIPGERARVTVTVNNISQAVPAEITQAGLTIIASNGTNGQFGPSTFPVIAAGGSATNAAPFDIQVPSDLRCGSTATLELQLDTADGRVKLPLRVRVGRSTGQQSVLLNDDVDAARVKWKFKKGFSLSTITGNSGSRSYHAVDPGKEEDDEQLATMTMKKKINIPANAGRVRLTFFHIFNFEPGFDGGVLEISTDNGATWEDLGSRVIAGGYDGKVTEASFNPLGNRFAWTARGRAGVFSPVVINLDDFAGKRVQLRFVAGFDTATGVRDGYTGWFIDDIRLTTELFDCR
ncbi:MAG TPA: S8 family serine peptidase [Blastocatellia bacterium]|nr:S8 family serine peptidase [Blastocatellia bacterium]